MTVAKRGAGVLWSEAFDDAQDRGGRGRRVSCVAKGAGCREDVRRAVTQSVPQRLAFGGRRRGGTERKGGDASGDRHDVRKGADWADPNLVDKRRRRIRHCDPHSVVG